jgi:hypothetical protein
VGSTVQHAKKPSYLDIVGDAESRTLWSLLNERERAGFTAVLQNPQGTKARELLEEHDVDAVRFEPWWTVLPPDNNAGAAVLNNIVVPLPALPTGATATSPNFAFNLFSIWSVLEGSFSLMPTDE